LRVAKFSPAAVRSAGRCALCWFAQARDIMPQLVISCSRIGFGTVVSNSTVWSSMRRISFTEASTPWMFDPGPRARSAENTTSSAVKGVPSENFTPRRRWKRHTVGDGFSHRSASAGSTRICASRRTSGS
jgi:hypothetical protein